MTAPAILETDALTKSYGTRRVVDRLNLDVREGDVFGFLGPNGAGKSTTIRMILDLVRPSSGAVRLFGTTMARDRRAILARVGALVERADFYGYLDGLTNLRLLMRQAGLREPKRAEAVLDLVGLSGRGGDKVRTYSHGMRQRLGIAQALLCRPQFILLDEPTTGLDPLGMKEVRELLRDLAQQYGITVFLSSHLLSEVEQICTRVAILHHGRLVAQGTVDDLAQGEYDALDVATEDTLAARDALRVAAGSFFATHSIEDHPRHLRVMVTRGAAAALNAHLVHDGVAVSALTPVRSLEEYFLRITEESSGDRGTGGRA